MSNEELYKKLACPECYEKVLKKGDEIHCQNPNCGLQYPVREGIPVMLVEEARRPEGEKKEEG